MDHRRVRVRAGETALATVEILMPALSPTMSEGNLARWLKHEGDAVARGEIIAEIETDKSVVEFVASDSGILGRILVPAGTENVPVSRPIATLITPAAEGVPAEARAGPVEPILDTGVRSGRQESAPHIAVSPLARRIAREAGIDYRQLTGSGPGGRIVRADVERTRPAAAPAIGYTEVAVSAVRRSIARRMSEAKASIPHFYLTIDCRMDALLQLRTELNAGGDERRVSVNDCIIRAAALTLRKVPAVNASWHGSSLRLYDRVDIAVAVATPVGLITPIIRNADEKSIAAIAAEMAVLIARARSGRLEPAEYQGGGFTISNLGMYGIREFAPIINPPQAGILAVGALEKRAVVDQEAIQVATMLSCTLAADHRVIDGAVGAEFLAVLRRLLEEPAALADEPPGQTIPDPGSR